MRWRTGRKVGRTIYLDDNLVGLMDTPELAARAARALNELDSREESFSASLVTVKCVIDGRQVLVTEISFDNGERWISAPTLDDPSFKVRGLREPPYIILKCASLVTYFRVNDRMRDVCVKFFRNNKLHNQKRFKAVLKNVNYATRELYLEIRGDDEMIKKLLSAWCRLAHGEPIEEMMR